MHSTPIAIPSTTSGRTVSSSSMLWAYLKEGELEKPPVLFSFLYFQHMGELAARSGFLSQESVINDRLAKDFPEVEFEESELGTDHAGDIDYLGKVGEKYFGIQIKPVTANANFANYKFQSG